MIKKITREDVRKDRDLVRSINVPQESLVWINKFIKKLKEIGEKPDVTKSRQ